MFTVNSILFLGREKDKQYTLRAIILYFKETKIKTLVSKSNYICLSIGKSIPA